MTAVRPVDVLRPALVRTLFPGLPRGLRPVFAVALVGLPVILATLVVLRWQAASIGVAVLGFPVLLVVYLAMTGTLRRRPRRTWLLAAVIGTMLGIGWALTTAAWIARSYGVGFGAGLAGGPNGASLGVPLGAVLLMVTPAVVVRLVDSTSGRWLDGYRIGVVGATAFGVAATVLRVVPQLATGPLSPHRPLEGLLVEAGIRGVVIPMTSTAIGGIAGVALWFSGGRYRPLAAAATLAGIGLAGGTALVDASSLGPRTELLLHLGVTVLALVVLRAAQQLARRRENSPEDPGRVPAPWRALIPIVAGLAVCALGATGVSMALTKPVARYACPPECGGPPTGTAVSANPRFTDPGGAFSVSYPAEGAGYRTTTGAGGVVAELAKGDGGVLRLYGEPARGRSAEQVVQDVLTAARPNSQRAYVIPNAMVGYQAGYGEVGDDYPISTTGQFQRLRLVTVAAVKDDYALIAAAVGPFHQFGPDFGPGPPSAVSLQMALHMDSYVNSFRWRGDPDF